MTTNTAAETPRKLNMEEKRRLEKVLLSDIDRAIGDYKATRTTVRNEQTERLKDKPPVEVKADFALYLKAVAERDDAQKRIQMLGYDVGTDYPRYEPTLKLNYSRPPEAISQYDDETARVEKALAAMKRTYTLKLFAGGEEAQELFASLSRDLEAIIAA
jgi:hypothetical protein